MADSNLVVKEIESFPANCNPMHHDMYHMAKGIGNNITILYAQHEHNDYIIIVDKISGKRLRISNFAAPVVEEPLPE